MASQEKREFDKYLKFLTFKVAQVVVQSRQGVRVRTKSNPQGNDWFNLAVPDDRQVSQELKRALEGRLPQPDQPACVEIQMETPEGETLVLEVWCVSLDGRRDIGVSVSHMLYPRLSLMLKSLVALSRTTPAYRLSRRQEGELKFTFRVCLGPPDVALKDKEFKHVKFAQTSCPHGTIGLSVYYRTSITLPTRSEEDSLGAPMAAYSRENSGSDCSLSSGRQLKLPFAPLKTDIRYHRGPLDSPQPFHAILPHGEPFLREESTDDTSPASDDLCPDPEPTSLAVAHEEQDGYIMVDLADIKPAFASRSHTDELSEFLQQCREVPPLDMFSGEHSMDVGAALKLLDERSHISESSSVNAT